jgi:hypothetical protein
MTAIDGNGWTATPIRLLDVPLNDDWLASTSHAATTSRSRLFAAQLELPAPQRAQVLYFDLKRMTGCDDVVDRVVNWARCYHETLPSEITPATLVAIGTKVGNEGRQRLLAEKVYYLNEARRSLRRVMGSGDRTQQIYRLIHSLSGFFIVTAVPPGAAATGRGRGTPQPAASDWDAYTKRPQHVDPKEVETLFEMLSKPEDWERDH